MKIFLTFGFGASGGTSQVPNPLWATLADVTTTFK